MKDSPLSIRVFIKLLCLNLPLTALIGAEVFPAKQMKVVGPIEYGQPASHVRYTGHPKYQAFEFNARPGDHLEVSIATKSRKLRAFLTDAKFESLAGGSQHFNASIPNGSKPASYYIVITEPDGRAAAYSLELQRPDH